jgi:hypothetical protein
MSFTRLCSGPLGARFCLRQQGTSIFLFDVFPRAARKNVKPKEKSTALPKAKKAPAA